MQVGGGQERTCDRPVILTEIDVLPVDQKRRSIEDCRRLVAERKKICSSSRGFKMLSRKIVKKGTTDEELVFRVDRKFRQTRVD